MRRIHDGGYTRLVVGTEQGSSAGSDNVVADLRCERRMLCPDLLSWKSYMKKRRLMLKDQLYDILKAA